MNFYSNGKLLISGEYLVLKGATALAVPVKYGQALQVSKSAGENELVWESREMDDPWFNATFKLPFFDVVESTDGSIARNLVSHFQAIEELRPGFIKKMSGSHILTNLDFKRDWGFGSSSSLVSNLAYWAELNPFDLHKLLSEGSGYDVVCAREDGPLFFTLKQGDYSTEATDLPGTVTDHLFFAYLGIKKNSAKSVAKFLSEKKAYRVEKRLISELSRHLAKTKNILDFGYYMKEHEQIMSSLLKIPALKDERFKDLTGEIKSLGAWGGDFAMIAWNDTTKDLKNYLLKKGIDTVFAYKELVKTR